ncbi:MAG: hypothetical protein H6713_42785 [Myxococcales bacterium]|nr:hypothetical protein [Myxococcales bacterium]MCB9756691.1 hypothetical protein [Myxococcales bacterium]
MRAPRIALPALPLGAALCLGCVSAVNTDPPLAGEFPDVAAPSSANADADARPAGWSGRGPDPCEFRAPEFYPDEGVGSRFGPPQPPEGTGRLKAPAVRVILSDPSAANRPYTIRAEVVHDSGLQSVQLVWNTAMQRAWSYECGGPSPPGVQVRCAQLGYTYVFVVVPPPGPHSFGVAARAVDGGMTTKTIATEFVRCEDRDAE